MDIEQSIVEKIKEKINEIIPVSMISVETAFIRDVKLSIFLVSSFNTYTQQELEEVNTRLFYLKCTVVEDNETAFKIAFFSSNLGTNYDRLAEREFVYSSYIEPKFKVYKPNEPIEVLNLLSEVIGSMKAIDTVEMDSVEPVLFRLGSNNYFIANLSMRLVEGFNDLSDKDNISKDVYNQINYLIRRLNAAFVGFNYENNTIKTSIIFTLN